MRLIRFTPILKSLIKGVSRKIIQIQQHLSHQSSENKDERNFISDLMSLMYTMKAFREMFVDSGFVTQKITDDFERLHQSFLETKKSMFNQQFLDNLRTQWPLLTETAKKSVFNALKPHITIGRQTRPYLSDLETLNIYAKAKCYHAKFQQKLTRHFDSPYLLKWQKKRNRALSQKRLLLNEAGLVKWYTSLWEPGKVFYDWAKIIIKRGAMAKELGLNHYFEVVAPIRWLSPLTANQLVSRMFKSFGKRFGRVVYIAEQLKKRSEAPYIVEGKKNASHSDYYYPPCTLLSDPSTECGECNSDSILSPDNFYIDYKTVRKGLFDEFKRFYGIQFTVKGQIAEASTYTEMWEYKDSQQQTCKIIVDLCHRSGYENGPHSNLLTGSPHLGKQHTLSFVKMALPVDTQGMPVFTTLNDISVLFHEVGHTIDFQSAPGKTFEDNQIFGSQIDAIEVMAIFSEFLPLQKNWLSKHIFPHHKLKNDVDKARYCFNQQMTRVIGMVRLLRIAMIDLSVHCTTKLKKVSDVKSIIDKHVTSGDVLPRIHPTNLFFLNRLTEKEVFSMYAAGFYAYILGDVLSHHLRTKFLDKAYNLDPTIGEEIRTHLLEPGRNKTFAQKWEKLTESIGVSADPLHSIDQMFEAEVSRLESLAEPILSKLPIVRH